MSAISAHRSVAMVILEDDETEDGSNVSVSPTAKQHVYSFSSAFQQKNDTHTHTHNPDDHLTSVIYTRA